MHAAACIIIAWATATNHAITLKGLNGMPRGRIKFNKRTRSRLNAAAAVKFQRLMWEKARWNGIEAPVMHPRNTSARRRMCRSYLSGAYHLQKCMLHDSRRSGRERSAQHAAGCKWRTIAAARYGRRVPSVRPSLDEARLLPDIMPDPAGSCVVQWGGIQYF